MKIIDYQIIFVQEKIRKDESIIMLQEMIRDEISNGWQPFGNIVPIKDYALAAGGVRTACLLLQALVRYEENDSN